jgi:hypothetical protein
MHVGVSLPVILLEGYEASFGHADTPLQRQISLNIRRIG